MIKSVGTDNNSDNVPEPLVEQIVARRCALFLGPDVAETAGGYRGLPTSWQLADELAGLSAYRGHYRPLPQIAQVYEHSHGRQQLIDYLRRRLDDPVYQPLPIHELIARIPLTIIVHAGWDRLLEQALAKQGTTYQLIQSVHDIPYTLPGQGLVLYKPYGRLDQPDSLVITERDQLNVFYQLRTLKGRLADLMASHSLLMIGYAPDYDSVFVRIYHEISQVQEAHRPPSFVVASLGRAEDARQWQARGITPLVADPGQFLYSLAQAVAAATGQPLSLPDINDIAQAPAATQDDLMAQTQALNRVLDTVGVHALVEQTDVPLLSAAQVRDLEAMRAAYERLASSVETTADSAQVWLRQGNIEYSRQNYDNAQRYYDLALEANPDLAEAYHNRHYVHLALGQLDEAYQSYRRSVALNPELALLPPRYQIDAILGRGGMGVVYRATDQETGQVVAVKVLDRAHMRTERLAARFQREAAILQRLEHPHVVSCLDFQQYQGRMFIVLEYLGDLTLARLLAQEGRLSLDQSYTWLQQLCQAVSFAHSLRIIHRDIKPANIFIVEGQVKLIDCGLAADLEAGQPSVIGLPTGTIAYMAPEQVAGQPVDERTDLYALATLFYEMITGRHPGQGAYRPPADIVPGLNNALDIVLQKARERNPADRYATVEEFCQEMGRVIPLQPASRQAAPWRRALAQLEQGLQKYRAWLLIAALLAGLLLPYWQPLEAGRVLLRVGSLVLWAGLLLSFLTDLFTAWLARYHGYASLSAYSALTGLVLGSAIGGLTILTAVNSYDFGGDVDRIEYTIILVFQSVAAVLVGSFSFLAAMAGTRLALRLRLAPTLGAISGYGLPLVLYALIVLSLTQTAPGQGG